MKRLQNKKLLDVGVAPLCLPRKDLGKQVGIWANTGGIAATNNIMNICNIVCNGFIAKQLVGYSHSFHLRKTKNREHLSQK